MAKTITALLVGIALDQGKIASLDDPVTRYLPELAGTGYDGATIRQVMQMRSGVDYQERYDFGENPSFAARLHEQSIVLNACVSPTAPARPGAPARPAAHSIIRRSIRS
jgi:CubicO group peptidase (beta-lactamase class C family)